MIEQKHRALASVYLINDAVASTLAIFLAWVLRFRFQIIPVTKGQQDLTAYLELMPLIAIVFPLAFAVQGLYRMRTTRGRTEEWVGVAVGSIVATVVLSGLLLWLRPGNPDVLYSRATLGIFMVCAMLFVITGRTLIRAIVERRHREGRGLDRVLIAGSGDLARAVVERMRAHHDELGFRIAGYLRNGEEASLDGLPCLGSIDDAEEIIEKNGIDHVFVALPHASSSAMMALL
ncbi:MAG TPA: hypothetical protein VGR95_08420, partial [Thermoanaerobaculia bacterium]|nr:hypothetical protein [Thermoanaerobaculia bacterium]